VIIGFVGKMGSGKTLCMTMLAYRYYKQGCKVFANYGLLFPHEAIDYQKIKGLDIEFQNSFMGLDEIHTFIDSRSSMKSINRTTSYFITQSRKRQLVFGYTTQRWGQTDVRLRNNTDYIWHCKKVEYGGETYIKVEMYDFDGKVTRLRIHANPYFGLYDTKQIVNPFEESDNAAKTKTKLKSGSVKELDTG
jgi:hypothetical protein